MSYHSVTNSERVISLPFCVHSSVGTNCVVVDVLRLISDFRGIKSSLEPLRAVINVWLGLLIAKLFSDVTFGTLLDLLLEDIGVL